MTITYIHHSGYLLETEQALLLFDFVEGALPPLDPAKDLEMRPLISALI